jgi:transcriptional regulator with XRE-family HTH domain
MSEVLASMGRNVRRLRREKGWSQAELALRSDTSPSIVSLIENGKRNASTATLERIADALNVPLVDLFPKARRRSSRKSKVDEGRRVFSFSKAIRDAAETWGEAVSSPDMDSKERLALIQAALSLNRIIGERSERHAWEALPNAERHKIVGTMAALTDAAEAGLSQAKESEEVAAMQEQVNRRREEMRRMTRKISA